LEKIINPVGNFSYRVFAMFRKIKQACGNNNLYIGNMKQKEIEKRMYSCEYNKI